MNLIFWILNPILFIFYIVLIIIESSHNLENSVVKFIALMVTLLPAPLLFFYYGLNLV